MDCESWETCRMCRNIGCNIFGHTFGININCFLLYQKCSGGGLRIDTHTV